MVEQLEYEHLYSRAGDQPRFSAVLSQHKPSFTAEIAGVASLSEELSEVYTIRCEPEQDAVDDLLVEFRPASSQPVHFRVPVAGEGALVARRLSAAEQAAHGLPAEAEHWRLKLAEARLGPFEVVAERRTPRADEMHLSLLSLPDAAAQPARITIQAPGGLPLSIRASGVTPAKVGAEEAAMTRAVYDYPAEEAGGHITLVAEAGVLAPKLGACMATTSRIAI